MVARIDLDTDHGLNQVAVKACEKFCASALLGRRRNRHEGHQDGKEESLIHVILRSRVPRVATSSARECVGGIHVNRNLYDRFL